MLEGTGVTYQWYSNTIKSNTGGTLIPGATGSSYSPPTGSIDHLYFYCEVSNSCDTVLSETSGAYVVYWPEGCNSNVFDLGKTSFKSGQTWTFTGTVGGTTITQEWSDVVMADSCNKTTFDGGSTANYNADCRTNPGYGDLFSWCAVSRFQAELCPDGWRVPTKEDFVRLNIALGGTGVTGQNNKLLRDKYLSDWGGAYGGYCNTTGGLMANGNMTGTFNAIYWALSSYATDPSKGYQLLLSSFDLPIPTIYNVSPNYPDVKEKGNTLRCVRDK
jgi:uncharacterized protein (TIGR02145 family)